MLLEFIDLNSPPVVAVNCDDQKAMGKEKMAVFGVDQKGHFFKKK